jgi:hypothetical protein
MDFVCEHWESLDAAALNQVQQESPPTGLFGLFG